MSRTKKVLTGIVDRNGAEEAFALFAKASARANQITAKMDVEITRIREKYQADLTALGAEKEENFNKLMNYAENHRDDFGKKKSLDFTHGVIGYRTGQPSPKTKKGYTWASVMNLMKEFMPDYIRLKEEPNKERLLADREDPKVASLFDKIGVYIDQSESFFVEPKQELIEA